MSYFSMTIDFICIYFIFLFNFTFWFSHVQKFFFVFLFSIYIRDLPVFLRIFCKYALHVPPEIIMVYKYLYSFYGSSSL